MSGAHTVLYDPYGLVDAELPLDRAPYEALVTAVLAWQNPNLTPRDYAQIALQLTAHARAVAADVQRHAAALPRTTAAAPSPKSSCAKPPAASPHRSGPPHAAPRTAPASCAPSTRGWTASQKPSALLRREGALRSSVAAETNSAPRWVAHGLPQRFFSVRVRNSRGVTSGHGHVGDHLRLGQGSRPALSRSGPAERGRVGRPSSK